MSARLGSVLLLTAAFVSLVMGSCRPAEAQVAIAGGIGGLGGNIGGGGVAGVAGVAGAVAGGVAGQVQGGGAPAGISIDAQGVVKPIFVSKKAAALSKKRMESVAKDLLPGDVNVPSQLRKVSLVRLEAACRQYVERGEAVPPDMQFLAGLQRIDYLFVYPETNDLVIAGPAEGYAADASGRVVGLSTGRPPLRLDDLIVSLRAVEGGGQIGCSIDPEPERLAALKRYVAGLGVTSPRVAEQRYHKMRDILGMQNVRVWGVDPETHFAQALVEADYRMKLISLGLERPPVRGLLSHLQLVGSGGNSMQRWWFVPLYDAFHTTDEHDAFRFAGPRVQLLSQEEHVGPQGQRSDAPFTRLSTRRFAQIFTEKFPKLAEVSPVFAELQNLFDLAVMAALLKKEGLPAEVGWKMTLFLDRRRVKVEKGNVPREVPSAVNYRRSRRGLYVGLIGGGVTLDPRATVEAIQLKVDPAVRLPGIRTSAAREEPPPEHPWWWD